MSSRSDAVRVTEPVTAQAESLRPRSTTGVAAFAAATLAATLVACGGGGGADPNQLVVNATVTGLVPLSASGLYGGVAKVEVRRADGTLLQPLTIDSASLNQGVYSFTVNQPVGTALQLVLTQHPRNQLCAVSTSGLQVGQSQASARLDCVPAILNDTGVTTCATPDRPGLCSAQDHQYGRDTERQRLNRVNADAALSASGFDYTRVCNSGSIEGQGTCPTGANLMRGTGASEWGCTRDNVTGLLWLIREAPSAVKVEGLDLIRPADSLNSVCGGSASRGPWMLPTAHELASIIDSGKRSPDLAANIVYLPNLAQAVTPSFWTRSFVRAESEKIFVDFKAPDGVGGGIGVGRAGDGDSHHIIWVANQAALVPPGYDSKQRFVVRQGNAVVRDLRYGLDWSACSLSSVGPVSGAPCSAGTGYSLGDALAALRDANTAGWGGHNDWRLPNRSELMSLLDYDSTDGVLLSSQLPQSFRDDARLGGDGVSYWTSTAVPDPSGIRCGNFTRTLPFEVHFGEGTVSALFPEDCPGDLDERKLRVRLVRDAR